MRITYVVKYIAQLGGLDRVLTFKMNWLAAHGHDVQLITYEQGDHPLSFALDPRIRHTDIGVKLWKKGGTGIAARTWSYLRLRRRFRRRMGSAVALAAPDVLVLLTDSYPVIDILMSLPTAARRIVETHVERRAFAKAGDFSHRNPVLRFAARAYDAYMARHIARADALVCLTQADASQWPEVPRVEVIANPLTVEPTAIATCTAPRAMAAGRLEDQKGFDMLVSAWADVHRRQPLWHLHIYGDGPDGPRLQQQIADAGLDDVVHLHSATPDIFERYAESSIFVLSSRYEGYGLVLAEAMSVGVPCVSFDCPYGPADIIRADDDGILVPPQRTDLLADAIVRLAADTALRQAMGQRARTHIRRYAPAPIMQRWQHLFATVVQAPAP